MQAIFSCLCTRTARTLKSFPVFSEALTYILKRCPRPCRSRARITDGKDPGGSTRGYLSRRAFSLVYHIATLTTSLRDVLRDYSSSPRKATREWHAIPGAYSYLSDPPKFPCTFRGAVTSGGYENCICMRLFRSTNGIWPFKYGCQLDWPRERDFS